MKRLLTLFFCPIYLACGLLFSSNEPLVYLRISDASTLDPGEYDDIYSGEVISNIFEGLVRFKKGSNDIEPCLAIKWETKDNGRKWIFYLRQGVRFHNGEPFDAHAVVYSFLKRTERIKNSYMVWNTLFEYMCDIKATGKYRVEIILKKTYAPLLSALTDPFAFIVARGSYEKPKFDPIGTGPFVFDKWKKEEFLSLKKNDEYWGGKVHLSRIVFKLNNDIELRLEQIKNGNADVISITSAREREQLLGLRDVEILPLSSLSTYYLAFNMRKKPFERIEVRKAISHLINKQVLIKQIFQNSAIAAVSPLPPMLFGFNKKIKDYPFDLNKAKELIRSAGLESGFDCSLYFSEGNYGTEKIANIFIKNARTIKINIKKVRLPFTTLLKKARNGDHDMIIMGWAAGPDPDFFLYSPFTLGKDNLNFNFYEDKELKEVLVKARESLDLINRITLYGKAQEIIQKNILWIPLYHLQNLIAYNKNVKKLYMNPLRCLIFKDSYKEN